MKPYNKKLVACLAMLTASVAGAFGLEFDAAVITRSVHEGDWYRLKAYIDGGHAEALMVSEDSPRGNQGHTMLHELAFMHDFGSETSSLGKGLRYFLVERALRLGSDANLKSAGGTLLVLATASEQVEMMELLLANEADVNAVGDNNLRVMDLIASKRDAELRQKMLAVVMANGGVDMSYVDDAGKTLLMRSVESGMEMASIRILLENGANPNIADARGVTPLLVAVQQGNDELVDLLLNHDAEWIDVSTLSDEVVLELAEGWYAMLKELKTADLS